MYTVGYFEGGSAECFQVLHDFDNEDDARYYVKLNYTEDAEGQPQNVVILHYSRIIYDGRFIGLN